MQYLWLGHHVLGCLCRTWLEEIGQSESPSKQSFYCHHELESLLTSTDVSVYDFSKYKGSWGESQEGLRRRLKSQSLVCLVYSPHAIYTSEGRGVRGHQGSWRDQENTGRLLHTVSFLLSGNPLHAFAALTHHTHEKVTARDGYRHRFWHER